MTRRVRVPVARPCTTLLVSLIAPLVACSSAPDTVPRPESLPILLAPEQEVPAEKVINLARLVDRRLSFMRDVAAYKWVHGLSIEDREREAVVLDNSMVRALLHGLDAGSVRPFFELQIDIAKSIQARWFDRWKHESFEPAAGPDLTTEIRPALLDLGDEILRAVADLAPWRYSPEALEERAPAFVETLTDDLVPTEAREKLFQTIVSIRPCARSAMPRAPRPFD